MQTGQQNSQLEHETTNYPANVIHQNIGAYAETSALNIASTAQSRRVGQQWLPVSLPKAVQRSAEALCTITG